MQHARGCVVINCNNSESTGCPPGTRFFVIPKVIRHFGPEDFKRSSDRQKLWLTRINRRDITYGDCVCSDHFVSGAPSSYHEVNSVDWAPSLKLGQNSSQISSAVAKPEESQLIGLPQIKSKKLNCLKRSSDSFVAAQSTSNAKVSVSINPYEKQSNSCDRSAELCKNNAENISETLSSTVKLKKPESIQKIIILTETPVQSSSPKKICDKPNPNFGICSSNAQNTGNNVQALKPNFSSNINSSKISSAVAKPEESQLIGLPQIKSKKLDKNLIHEKITVRGMLEASVKQPAKILQGLKRSSDSFDATQSTSNAKVSVSINPYEKQSNSCDRSAELCKNNAENISETLSSTVKLKKPKIMILTETPVQSSSPKKICDKSNPNFGICSSNAQSTGNNVQALKPNLSSNIKINPIILQKQSECERLKSEHTTLKMKYDSLLKKYEASCQTVCTLENDLKSSELEKQDLQNKLKSATELANYKSNELRLIKDIVTLKTKEILELNEEFQTKLREEYEMKMLRKISALTPI